MRSQFAATVEDFDDPRDHPADRAPVTDEWSGPFSGLVVIYIV